MTVWLNRQHGEVDFFLTQLLSGHGFSRKYLHERGFASSAQCPECGFEKQTAKHILFDCARFEEARRETLEVAEVRLTVNNLVGEMCRNEHTWRAVYRLAQHTMSVLQQRFNEDERRHVLAGGTGRGRLDPSAGTRPIRVWDALPVMDRRGASGA